MGNIISSNKTEIFTNCKFYGYNLDNNNKYGKVTFKNNNFYKGTLINNLYNGYGEFNSNNLLISGNWINNNINGKAKVTFNDITYDGEFMNGIPNGIGKIYNKNGYFYFGEITNNILNGYGILKKKGNNIYSGKWRKNVPVDNIYLKNSIELLDIKSILKKIQIIDFSDSCSICKKSNFKVTYPCPHIHICTFCSNKLNECPICGINLLT